MNRIFPPKLKPDFWDHDQEKDEEHVSFRRMWWVNFLVAAVVSLVPALLLAALAFYHSTRIPGVEGDWFAMQILFFVIVSVLVILAVVYKGTVDQVSRLYHYHLDQTRVLREVAYTHKLASLGRLAAGVAHQINNPMAIVNEKAGLIRDILTQEPGMLAQARVAKLAEDIQNAAKGAGSITHRLLDFARHQAVAPGPVDLDQLLREVAGFLVHEADHHAIDVVVRPLSRFVVIQSDRSLLEQAFFNIINNAVTAVTAREGASRIEITVKDRPEGKIEVAICDDGGGIPAKDLTHIFEPFYASHAEMGGGLGLFITHRIIHRLGGDIDIQSQEGQGTKVMVFLPADPGEKAKKPIGLEPGQAPEPALSGPPDSLSPGASEAPGILLVDDDEDYIEIVAERLGMRGHRLEWARDGLEALAKLEIHPYHTVIMDMMMPGLDGMETLKRIREQYPQTQVILQTGFTTAELQKAGEESGAAAILEKPVNLDIVCKMIDAAG